MVNNSIIARRVFAYCIDYFICAIIAIAISLVCGTYSGFETNQDYPFLIMELVFAPLMFFYELYSHPGAYGVVNWLFTVIILVNAIEILYYIVFNILFKGKTIGYKFCGIELKYNTVKSLIIRSIIKCMLKYTAYVPFFLITIDGKMTVYDKITKSYVSMR